MTDQDAKAALLALLSNFADIDDPALADQAIDLYLGRFGDDGPARLFAISRLTDAALRTAAPDRDPVEARDQAPAPPLARTPD